MEKRFSFDEKRHLYFLDGKPLTGVTSVLNVIAKPALIGWAVNMACEYIRDNYSVGCAMESLLEEAKIAHRKKKEGAADIGKRVHKYLEEWIANEPSEETDEQVMKVARNFIGWAEKNKVKFLASEKRVYSPTLFIAGTLDFICEIDGKKYVGDIKTSSGVYGRAYFAQCAGYRLMLEEMGEKDFEGSIIVRIGKDGLFSEEKDVLMSPNYEDDKRYFLAALDIYRMDKNLYEQT